eukprot:CAMPEP_0197620866 /NCGR_PEP_ID=MMETSP1338-20131121/1587_1 /TAXON_ID=43686 ORGANISM="Pelagodinium beii, Strain RCC1491" /NCGR_SAMPLE_ID=MMETSP1338 /ASSEMBLY_ACC=CAM_ASM_000754 /LENGTH=139 /DNA_ID=CAMNT_0043190163 /DNA_START=79 /DNA_END=498 /DNA_ORIENTATION=+
MPLFRSIQLLALAATVAGTQHLRFKAHEDRIVIALDKDMKTKMLVQVGSSASRGLCDDIACGDLSCPSGFTPTKVDGHCCPYCINPDLELEKEAKGASGKYGGEVSRFCADVWCFPTMCDKDIIQPSTKNGHCCPKCPA